MTGMLPLDKEETFYESFFFPEVDKESGRLLSLTERAVRGEVGKQDMHGMT
jgi:hypothetical protein